jgi:hypothetical protein
MSFVIWYKVEISQAAPDGPLGIITSAAAISGLGLPVSVSNDVFAGSLILDADITVTMTEGASADTFEITLINLPIRTTDLIRAVRSTQALAISVHLGYFDEPAMRTTDVGRVLDGRITRVTSCVGDDGLARTTLYGQEEAGYRLRRAEASRSQDEQRPAIDFVGDLVGDAEVQLAQGSTLPGQLSGYTVRAGSTLDAVADLADQGGVPMVVRDGKVLLGAAVGDAGDTAPMEFNPDTNIVSLDTTNGEDSDDQPDPPVRNTLDLIVLGHPQLRVGQIAKVTGLDDVPEGPWRISQVVHRFGIGGGYTARVTLISAVAGQAGKIATGVQGAVNRVRDVIARAQDDHPAIDVGEVTSYAPGSDGQHEATMHYGQKPARSVVTPSVGSPVETGLDLHDKPIASPFAFDQTGLIVPVYPKMRALLAHNRGLVNDAVVAGFVWPDSPELRRPPNEPGDYWLALPSELGDDDLPSGKGINDLTDRTGRRVIQTRALHIVVGAESLPDVGTRPDLPDNETITIEHASGTTIAIDANGQVTITTSNQGITLTNGSVSLKLDGAQVKVA